MSARLGQGFSVAALLVALGLTAIPNAEAQSSAGWAAFRRDRNVSVRERPKPEYAAQGLAMGAFRLFPELTVSAVATDNVFAANTNEQSDIAFGLQTAARLQSQWSSNELRLTAGSDTLSYDDFSQQNRTNWNVGAYGRLDVYHDFYLYGRAGYESSHEELYSTGSLAALAEPIPFVDTTVSLGFVKFFNRLRASGDVRYADYDFDDTPLIGGGVAEEDDRDRGITEVSGRIDWAISPDTALFVAVTGNWRDYKLDPPAPGASVLRDSNGYEALVGASFDFSRLIRGEVGVGYLSQFYDAPNTKDSTGLALRSKVEWFPDELLTVTFQAVREVLDADAVNASSYVSSAFSLGLDYEYRRNVVLSAGYRFSNDDYEGVVRKYDRNQFELGADYLVNRTASLFLQLARYDQTSKELGGREYEIDRAIMGVRLRR